MNNLLSKYKDGNYIVRIYKDGTKIRTNKKDTFTPEFPEGIDCTITTKCDGNCSWCYLNCNENGIHGDLTDPIFDTLHSGIELAINANDCSHPGLEDFLIRMKNKGVIINITINQRHLNSNIEKLKNWQKRELIWGIGVSLSDSTSNTFIEDINKLNNVVIHVIDGCFTKQDLENLKDNNLKLLILGFKHVGRGIDYYNKNKNFIDNNIQFLREHLYDYRKNFGGFGFDNLSNENLHIRELVGEEKWNLRHIGDEGEFTYFLDCVNKKFAVSSMETEMFDMLDNIDDMFHFIRKKQGYE